MMADIRLHREIGHIYGGVFVNGVHQEMVIGFSIRWDPLGALPIIRIDRYKRGRDGRAYISNPWAVAEDQHIAKVTEYYPIHSLTVEEGAVHANLPRGDG